MECTICWLSRDLHAIILFYLRETPQTDNLHRWHSWWHSSVYFWHCFRDDGFTLMACVRSQRKHTYVLADTRVITYVIPSVMSSRQGWACPRATRSLEHVGTEIYRCLSLRHMTWINQSRPSIHPENLKSYNRVVEWVIWHSRQNIRGFYEFRFLWKYENIKA